MCTVQKIKANRLPSPPAPLQCHALRHRKPPTTSRHIRSHADSYRWLLGSSWAEKRQDQEFPGPRPPRHSTNLRVCICRDGWPSSVPGEAGSGGAGPALLTTEQSWKAGGFVQSPSAVTSPAPPQSYPKPYNNITNRQDLVLCGLYVSDAHTIKQNLVKQEGTGGAENILNSKVMRDHS